MRRFRFPFFFFILLLRLQGADSVSLMPQPAGLTSRTGWFPITRTFAVQVTGAGAGDPRIAAAQQRLIEGLRRTTGVPVLSPFLASGKAAPAQPPAFIIVVERKDHKPPQRLGDDESYHLDVTPERVRLSATEPLGVIRGVETFLQLVRPVPGTDPAVKGSFGAQAALIDDQPRFAWRGLSLDVSRHFLSVETIQRTLDGMAAVKLNVLHWHLSDDEGIRVESKKFPRLQQAGSLGDYYTQAQIRSIVAYAAARGIRVVPEFDVPGHATAILAAYPSLGAGPFPDAPAYEVQTTTVRHPGTLDPTNDATYKFLDGFFAEMAKLFPDEYFHVGGDEVNPSEWNKNSKIVAFRKKHNLANAAALQVYFNQKVAKIVSQQHKRMVAWDEVLGAGLPDTVLIEAWRKPKYIVEAATAGYQVISANGYYLDLAQPAGVHYAVDPFGADAAQMTKEQLARVLGGEAAMWEEIATDENIDSRLWPRLAAIAERFWSPASVTDVDSMYQRLALMDRRLEEAGLQQRVELSYMRRRLAGIKDPGPLDVMSGILEPVKGYKRHGTHQYSQEASFNRLVDSLPPESEPAREFRKDVDEYVNRLQGGRAVSDQENFERKLEAESLKQQLKVWQQAAHDAAILYSGNSLLAEIDPVASRVQEECRTGIELLDQLEQYGPASLPTEKPAQMTAALDQIDKALAEKPSAEITIAIAPAIRRLLSAATASGPAS